MYLKETKRYKIIILLSGEKFPVMRGFSPVFSFSASGPENIYGEHGSKSLKAMFQIFKKEIDKTVYTVYIVNIQKEQMKGMME